MMTVRSFLGDNVFHGADLSKSLKTAGEKKKGATVFAYPVHDPERYGVVELMIIGEH